jgi:GNAT superfamily N-acetyltransferase
MAELPTLSLGPATTRAERTSALHLIASSIAQQRQTVNFRILTHPYFLAPVVLLLSVVAKLNYRASVPGSLATVLILLAGVGIAVMSATQRYTSGYLDEAERIGCEDGLTRYLEAPGTDVVVAKWGGKVIGAVVVRGEDVWAWTVQLRYRGKGLGRDLLEKAVDRVRQRGGEEAVKRVKFAEDHASAFPQHGFVIWRES